MGRVWGLGFRVWGLIYALACLLCFFRFRVWGLIDAVLWVWFLCILRFGFLVG